MALSDAQFNALRRLFAGERQPSSSTIWTERDVVEALLAVAGLTGTTPGSTAASFDGVDSLLPLDYARRVALFDAAGDPRMVPALRVGLVVLPDAAGHLPVGTAALFAARLPGIVGNDVLQLAKETHEGHAAQAFWDEVSQAGDQIETPAAAQWVTGTDYAVGARVTYTAQGVTSRYVCIQAHTAGTVLGTAILGADPSQLFWTPYSLLDLANYIGVHQRVGDVDAPADNAWGYFVYNEFISTEQYRSSGGVMGWLPIGLGPGTNVLLGLFASESEASSAIHEFDGSGVTVAVFPNGSGEYRLHILLGHVSLAAEQVIYPWRPGRGDIINGRGKVGLRPPAEDGSDDLSLTITDSGVFWVRHTIHPHTKPTGDWAQYVHANLQGDGQFNYIPAVAAAGKYAFFNGGWWVSELVVWTNEYSWTPTAWRPANWRGRFLSRAEALDEAVLAGGNGVYATGQAIETLSNFVPAAARSERRAWDPVNAAGGWSEDDYWYESADITDVLAGLDVVQAEAQPGFAVSITNETIDYPNNPRDGVIGLGDNPVGRRCPHQHHRARLGEPVRHVADLWNRRRRCQCVH